MEGSVSDSIRQVTDLLRLMLAGDPHRERSVTFDEFTLMRDLRRPRRVIRAALADLAGQRLLVRSRGAGTSPSSAHFTMNTGLPPVGVPLDEHLGAPHFHPKLLSWQWVPAPSVIADRLDGVRTGDQVLCIDFVSMRSGQPLGLVTDYVREREGKRLRQQDFRSDFYSLLDNCQAGMHSCSFTMQAVSVDAPTAERLDVIAGDPAIRFEQLIRNANGEVFDFAVSTHRQDFRYSFDHILRDREATDRDPEEEQSG